MNNNSPLEEFPSDDVMIEQLVEISNEQAKRYNLLNPTTPMNKILRRSNPSSRNIIKNMLGYKNTT